MATNQNGNGNPFFSGSLFSSKAITRKSRKRKSKTMRYTRKKRRHYPKQKRPHTAGKRKDTSHRRIRYTRNNQPYVILANGRARFISKKSARISRKRTGGRY